PPRSPDPEPSSTEHVHRPVCGSLLGFRECNVADADKLIAWLAEHLACKERQPEQVRVELLVRGNRGLNHCDGQFAQFPTEYSRASVGSDHPE
ncbi:hypothetical protein ABT300_37290, partial [Streptomyces sp. NPDC001027]|uniref:hypothetical protein n=1 Tax=Streptomyces sp. NPDC001027 TaxID=3154771 RepID=UPI0033199553